MITQYRAAESERQAAEARRKVSESHPALRQSAERNAELAEERTELAGRLDENRNYLESIKKKLEELQKDFGVVTSRVRVAGMTPTVGLMLRNHRERLPQLSTYQQRRAKSGEELQRVQMAMFELQTERSGLGDLEETIEKTADELASTSLADLGTEKVHAMVREIMEARQQYIDKLLNDYDTYHDTLSDLEVVTHNLVEQIREYRAYIDEHVLWIRSAPSLSFSNAHEIRDRLRRLTDSKEGILALPRVIMSVARNQWWISMLVLLAVAGLFPTRLWLVRRLERIGMSAEQTLASTFLQLTSPVLLALPGPLTLCVISAWLGNYHDRSATGAISHAFLATACAWFIAAMLSNGFRPSGPAEGLFGAGGNAATLRAPATFDLSTTDCAGSVPARLAGGDAGSRLQCGTGAHHLHRNPALPGLLAASPAAAGEWRSVEHARRASASWPARMAPLWYAIGIGFPLALATLAAVGYYYTAWELLIRGLQSMGLVVASSTIYALGTRIRQLSWRIVRRREHPDSQWTARIESSWRSLLGGAVSLLLLGGIWWIWSDTFSALQILDRVELWSTTATVTRTTTNTAGEVVKQRVPETVPVTLADLGSCIVLLLAAIFAGRTLPALLSVTIVSRLPLDHGAKHAIIIITRYVVVLLGVIVALRAIGVSWASVQWLAAAMTVGLGFGLQEIFANLVSGLIILFERPIRIGDIVTVGGITGQGDQDADSSYDDHRLRPSRTDRSEQEIHHGRCRQLDSLGSGDSVCDSGRELPMVRIPSRRSRSCWRSPDGIRWC